MLTWQISKGYILYNSIYIKHPQNDKTRDGKLITGCQGAGKRIGIQVCSQNKPIFLNLSSKH